MKNQFWGSATYRRFRRLLLTLLLALSGAVAVAPSASAAPGNILPPFDPGQAWNICRGYGYASHTGTSTYGLDLTGAGCDNSASGRNVRAPVGGTVHYYQGAYGNLCISKAGGGSYTLTHIDASVTSGTITAGQLVGTVAAPNTRGNGGVAHIHFQMWSSAGCYGDAGVPFDAAHGARICGAPDLTPSGPNGYNIGTWSGTAFTGQGCDGASLSNGSYIVASDTGRVYVMAGGSPMYVSGWGAVGGPHSISQSFTQAQINAMPQYPADGTAIRNYGNGAIYVVAGGFGFGVSSLSHIPNTSWVDIDGSALGQLRSQPGDGTVIRDYVSGSIHVVSGGAALAVTSLANIPYSSWTNIDGWAIANQMRQYPTDGSAIVDYSDGTVYLIAGGAPMKVLSFGNIPPVTSLAFVDHWVLQNQLRQYPVDGTVIRDYVGGGIHVVAGGAALGIASLANVPYTSWINLDNWSITNQLRSYPADNTYVRDYTNGKVYLVENEATAHIPSWGPAGPQPFVDVDPWALNNQLHATG